MLQSAKTQARDIYSQQTPGYRMALRDLIGGGRDFRRWTAFAVMQAKRGYWRTRLGIFWLPISFMAFVVLLSVLWANILGRELELFMVHLGYGLICWSFINSTIAGGDQVFAANAGVIREFPLPLTFYAYAKTARDTISLVSYLVVMLAIEAAYIRGVGPTAIWALPALALYLATGVIASVIFGLVTTRFRDIGQLIPIVMRAAFFFTPVIWMVDGNPTRTMIATWNPLYHYIEIVRKPMSGQLPLALSWQVAAGTTLLLFLLMLIVYKLAARQIRIWL